jgi:hypothetical protein
MLELLGEFSTGSQLKSVYFSLKGDRLFVPLLDQHGVDVFHFLPQNTSLNRPVLTFEKILRFQAIRLLVLWRLSAIKTGGNLRVSNFMEEDKVHIYNLDTLEYRVMPKVIAQNPKGDI